MTPTVPTPSPGRETRKLTELKPGDWLSADEMEDTSGTASEVLSVHTSGGDWALIVLANFAGEPESITRTAPVELANPAEIEQARADRQRQQVAGKLRELADLIADRELPMPPGPVGVSFALASDAVQEIEEVSKLLGVEKHLLRGRFTAAWGDELDGPVFAEWVTYLPKTDTGMGYSREPDDPTPGDVPRGVEGGSVAGRASVPVLCAAVLADGVACGARIYWNVAANAWWHLWRKGEGADVLKHTPTGPSVPPAPDMQTRPQCSPDCRAYANGKNDHERSFHLDDCPVSLARLRADLQRGL